MGQRMSRSEQRTRTAQKDAESPLYLLIGMRLENVRRNQDIPKIVLAAALGVHATTLYFYEIGVRRIPLAFFVRWCEELQVSPTEVLQGAMDAAAESEGS